MRRTTGACDKCKVVYVITEDDKDDRRKHCYCGGTIHWTPVELRGDATPEIRK